jgi:hypothetical protein
MRSPSCITLSEETDPMHHEHERRATRSSSPHEAVRLFLQALVARHGLDALALANDDGLLMAGAVSPQHHAGSVPREADAPLDLDWIGAVGCVCAIGGRRGPSLGAVVERATGGRHLEAAEIVVRGERLYLAAVGGRLSAGWAEPSVAAGIERILSRSLPAVA